MGFKSLITSTALVAGAAALSTYTSSSGEALDVRVPSDTASSGSGPIYFQISAPSGTRWAAFGQGTGMRGAQMFVVYTSGSNNVTLSTRQGTGFVQPNYDSSVKATLLAGSGIRSDGSFVANIRCESCLSWSGGSMDPKDTASNWIWATQQGNAINSNDPGVSITRHDSRGEFTLDLTTGTGGGDVNPFVSAASSSSSSSPSSTATGTDSTTPSPSSDNGVSVPVATSHLNTANSGSSSADSTNRTIYNNPFSHGVLMSVLFVGLFPLASLTLYLPTTKKVRFIHAPLQAINLIILIVGMALGIVYGRQIEELDGYHQVIGYIVVALFVAVQPALGIYQHLHYRKTGDRSIIGVGHQWLGRTVMALGIINGGLGWNLNEETDAYVPYGVVAGIMFLIYVGVVIFGTWQQRRARQSPSSDQVEKAARTPSPDKETVVPK